MVFASNLGLWAGIVSTTLAATISTPLKVPIAPIDKKYKRHDESTASIAAPDGIFKGKVYGPLEMYRTFSKFNIPIPAHVQEAVDRHTQVMQQDVIIDQTSTVPSVSKEGDLLFVEPASIGTPPQQIFLDFDTGSADTWVLSNDTAKTQVKGQSLWDASKSGTAVKVPNTTWTILYGDMSRSSGIVYRDTFSLGNVVIPNMTIESARTVSSQFTKDKSMSGLVGLAFPSVIQTKPKQPALLDLLPGVLDKPVFTTDFRHNSSAGSFNFGYIDKALYAGEIQYVDIDDSDGFWGAAMTGFAVQGSSLAYQYASPPRVILDTGSTLFYAPDSAVSIYYSAFPSAIFSYRDGGWIIPCNSTPPNFVWELGDDKGGKVVGAVPGEYFVYAVLDKDQDPRAPDGYCFSGLQSLGSFPGVDGILGDVFLKSAFQVWDMGLKRWGSAPKSIDLPLTRTKERNAAKNAGITQDVHRFRRCGAKTVII